MARLLLSLAAGVLVVGAAASALQPAKWMQNGLIDAGGSHEPFSFLVRVGGESPDALPTYRHAQSEEVIRRLKEQGVEVFHTHLYKGFGMAAEMPEMEDARRAAGVAHRYGLKVDSYIQWNTLMYETFFAEEPRAKDWVQRDAEGRPILLPYGFQQSFRYRPCFSNPNYLAYLKTIVRYAVQNVNTDFIHFDNFDLNPEPESCHCSYCTRGFREFLKKKYSPALRRERFGFDNVDYVNPPIWNAENPPSSMEVIRDPVIQEWVAYRCHEMSEALRQMAEYAHSLKPEVAIEVNPHGITGANRAWEAGLDHAQFLKWTDAFWTEEPNNPALEEDGRLVTRIRSYKLARAFNNVLLSGVSANPVALAEDLAFNQTIGYAGEDPLDADTRKYITFYRNHRELYVNTHDDSSVGVLRSYPSITYHNARAQLGAVLVEQALIQSHVPFTLIFDEPLPDLSRYNVLILPDSECLSDAQIAAIKGYVEHGGGLVALGQAGLYDQWLRPRAQPGLHDLFSGQKPGRRFGDEVHWRELSGPTIKNEYGAGRVAYVPGVHFAGPLPPMTPFFAIKNEFWKKPENTAQIVDSVRWASRDALPVSVAGPDYLVANLVEQSANGLSLLHLVNYDAVRTPLLKNVQVTLQVPAGKRPSGLDLVSPDSNSQLNLSLRSDDSGAHFVIPEIRTYSVAVVHWR